MMRALRDEIHGAFGGIRRRPAFAIGAALSLALGMSLVTAIFSMVDAVFLRPLPYPRAEQLVHFSEIIPSTRAYRWGVTPRHLDAVRTSATSFASIAAWRYGTPPAVIGASGDARSYPAATVTTNSADVLGVRPVVGRFFIPSDAESASPPVVLSYDLWRSRFGGEPSVVGRAVAIGGVSHTVVGVMPERFDFPADVQLWFPLDENAIRADATSDLRDALFYAAIARLAPGVTPERATAELTVIFRRSDDAVHDAGTPFRPLAMPLAKHVTMEYREVSSIWIAAAIAIVILCAVNFATMALARGMRRRGEVAVRSALGAGPRRLVALLGAEGVMIALLGGAGAVLLARWLISFSHVWFGSSFAVEPSISWRTIGFGMLLTTIVGSMCALVPAIDLSRIDLRAVLSGDAGTITSGARELRGRRSLVALQIALALICVSSVGSFVQMARRAESRGPGYDYARMVTADLSIADSAARASAATDLREYLRGIPGIAAATVVRTASNGAMLWLDEHRRVEAAIAWHDVAPDYFTTFGLRAIAGRLPTQAEFANRAPVAVVSKTSARYLGYLSADSAVGHRVRWRDGHKMVWLTIVGVVPDVRYGPYFPAMSEPIYTVGGVSAPFANQRLFIRLTGAVSGGLAPLSAAVRRLDTRIVVTDLTSVNAQVEQWTVLSRGRGMFLMMIAAFSLLLAMVGVYSLTSFTTELRARELGVRIALGASEAKLARSIVGDLWAMGALGLAAGWLISGRVAALAGSYLLDQLRPPDRFVPNTVPTMIAAVALVCILVAGTWVPLRRVLRMDVMRAIQAG